MPGSKLDRVLLKNYLRWRFKFDRHVRDRLAMKFFNGLHPKNVFNYRSEFFVENVHSKDIVLDIGCGTGLILHKMAYRIDRGYGIDRDPGLEKYFLGLGPKQNVEFIVGDILGLDYAALKTRTSYNVCIASHVLEHIEDVPALLDQINAPTLLVCVPSQENWATQLQKHLGLPYLSDEGHYREYTRTALADELTRSRYRISFMGFNSEGEIICRAERPS